MIPAAAIGAGKWLLAGNWKWAVSSAIAAIAVVYAGAQRLNYLGCKADRAESVAAAKRAVRAFQAKDREHADALVGQYAGEIAELQGKYEDAQIRLAEAGSVAGCNRTPAARAFDDGVRNLDRESGDRDTDAAGDAGAAVPAPAGAAGRVRR
jgi:hypothetical protein